jgi:hypothetical protein
MAPTTPTPIDTTVKMEIAVARLRVEIKWRDAYIESLEKLIVELKKLVPEKACEAILHNALDEDDAGDELGVASRPDRFEQT